MISVDTAAVVGVERYAQHFEIIKALAHAARAGASDTLKLTVPEASLAAHNARYVEQETGHALNLASDLTNEAHQAVARFFGSTPHPEGPPTHTAPFLQLVSALSAQVVVDAAAGAAAVRKFHFDVLNIARSKGIDLKAALREARRNDYPVENVHTNRRNAQLRGEVYVRGLWRQAAVMTRAEATIAAIADHKQDLAIVIHPELNHASHGLIIGIGSVGGYPSWSDVRAKHFHPNSRALIAPYGGEDAFSI